MGKMEKLRSTEPQGQLETANCKMFVVSKMENFIEKTNRSRLNGCRWWKLMATGLERNGSGRIEIHHHISDQDLENSLTETQKQTKLAT